MIKTFRLVTIIIALFLLHGCRNAVEEYVYTGKISGTVILVGAIDGNYSGIVCTITSTVTNSNMTTGADGKFAFTGLPDGTYQLSCTKNGYTTGTQADIVISKSGSWSGTVYLVPGTPPDPPL